MSEAPIEADVMVKAAAVVTMNEGREVIGDGAVAVRDDRIVAVGKAADLAKRVEAAKVIEAPEGFLTPGLIDGHDHPQDSMPIGLFDYVGDSKNRMANYCIPFEHGISDDEAYVASLHTFALMLSNGTTCFMDPGGPTADGVARAAIESGIRGSIAARTNDLPGYMNFPVDGDIDFQIARASEKWEIWNGAANGRLRCHYNLDLPANLTDEACVAVVEAARERSAGITGHLVGRKHITDPSRSGRNEDVARYESLGVLGPDLTVAHIGWLGDADIEAFARLGVKGVHCPAQSMFGGTGVIAHGSVPEMVQAGVTVGLGSDAPCIARFIDMVRIMYLAACAHRDARMDQLVMDANKAFEMATIDGARAVWWEDEIGSLEVGKLADMVVFKTDALEWHPGPLTNPIGDLVYCSTGQAADTVLVNGQVVVEGGRVTSFDTDAVAREMDELYTTIFDRLGFEVTPKWPIR